MKEIPIPYIRNRMSYDPESGLLTWKERFSTDFASEKAQRRFNSIYAGKTAGGKMANGYLMVPFKDEAGKRCMFYAHRIAFALHYGRFPIAEIDHINGIRTDNRICNLREATRLQNAANTTMGLQKERGVTKRADNKWIAQISHMNNTCYLGTYATEAEAHAAFCGAATVLRQEFATLDHFRA